MAIRRTSDAPVEVLPDAIAEGLLRAGAFHANGLQPVPPRELQQIDERVEVVGLTDRDPEFFEKQGERIAAQVMDSALPSAPLDRMTHGRRRGR